MEDKILLVEHDEEAAELGWTCIGPIHYEKAWQHTAWVWVKEGKFVLLADRGAGCCSFEEFISREEARKKLCEYQNKRVN